MAKSLFITYDGLTDPLGQSQILPYLIGLSKAGHQVTILSCEKAGRYKEKGGFIDNLCNSNNLKWKPLIFHTKPPVLAKYYDLFNLKRTARKLYKRDRFDIVHCRSYLAADIGRKLKREFGCRYLFDMRGFWVDERIDGGLWNKNLLFYRYAYKIYKKKEAQYIADADHIISLTEAGKQEIESWKSYNMNSPITVIPCSADLNLFTLTDDEQKIKAREKLGIDEGAFVLSYLGSLGTWYLLDEMLHLFKTLKSIYPISKFLILTPDDPDLVLNRGSLIGLNKNDFIIMFSDRKNIPAIVKASDASVSFIKPCYSKIASSPTKLGELLAMGIPVICNSIGDVELIIKTSGGGMIINNFTEEGFEHIKSELPRLLIRDKSAIREQIKDYYSLNNAVATYNLVYLQLTN